MTTSDYITIPLTQGQFALIDVEFSDLCKLTWYAHKNPTRSSDRCYVAGTNIKQLNGNYKSKLMHRIILSRVLNRELLPHEQVDHVDLNPLNNRVSNLRLATPSQNCVNKKKRSDSTSPYKGVTYQKDSKNWRAYIFENGHIRTLGCFKTPELAHAAYCERAKELHGEFFNAG